MYEEQSFRSKGLEIENPSLCKKNIRKFVKQLPFLKMFLLNFPMR